MRRWLLAALLALPAGRLAAETPLTDTHAFEDADATSFYAFDACGDGLGGRMYRKALAARVAQCPFTAEAHSRFTKRARLQQEKSRIALENLIQANGGLSVQLDGMSQTCREQKASPEYQQLRVRLEQYAQGEMPIETVLPAPCDAATVTP